MICLTHVCRNSTIAAVGMGCFALKSFISVYGDGVQLLQTASAPISRQVLQKKSDMRHPQLSGHYDKPGLVAPCTWRASLSGACSILKYMAHTNNSHNKCPDPQLPWASDIKRRVYECDDVALTLASVFFSLSKEGTLDRHHISARPALCVAPKKLLVQGHEAVAPAQP